VSIGVVRRTKDALSAAGLSNLARLFLANGQPTEALALGETALVAHDKVLGRDHAWINRFVTTSAPKY
jgi:hypothetical protein